jgi:2-polyprenyl-3-methyl-5-hydroxy-6-metoxy-1,4-benzoquinol methylase
VVSKLDPRKIFAIPKVYDSYQKFVGAQQDRLNFLKKTVAPLVKYRVLDVGCGTGVNCEVFPQHVSYVGCDLSEKYINHAKQHYGNRAEFYAAPVGELQKLNLEPFDVVIAMAVLHHLSDEQL